MHTSQTLAIFLTTSHCKEKNTQNTQTIFIHSFSGSSSRGTKKADLGSDIVNGDALLRTQTHTQTLTVVVDKCSHTATHHLLETQRKEYEESSIKRKNANTMTKCLRKCVHVNSGEHFPPLIFFFFFCNISEPYFLHSYSCRLLEMHFLPF